VFVKQGLAVGQPRQVSRIPRNWGSVGENVKNEPSRRLKAALGRRVQIFNYLCSRFDTSAKVFPELLRGPIQNVPHTSLVTMTIPDCTAGFQIPRASPLVSSVMTHACVTYVVISITPSGFTTPYDTRFPSKSLHQRWIGRGRLLTKSTDVCKREWSDFIDGSLSG